MYSVFVARLAVGLHTLQQTLFILKLLKITDYLIFRNIQLTVFWTQFIYSIKPYNVMHLDFLYLPLVCSCFSLKWLNVIHNYIKVN
jgi:hypothetical protein